jgi:hypothetical protein
MKSITVVNVMRPFSFQLTKKKFHKIKKRVLQNMILVTKKEGSGRKIYISGHKGDQLKPFKRLFLPDPCPRCQYHVL